MGGDGRHFTLSQSLSSFSLPSSSPVHYLLILHLANFSPPSLGLSFSFYGSLYRHTGLHAHSYHIIINSDKDTSTKDQQGVIDII